MSRSRSDGLSAKIEELRRKLGALPEGADLGEFLDRECTRFARLLREDLVAGHERAASPARGFSPLWSVRAARAKGCRVWGARSVRL